MKPAKNISQIEAEITEEFLRFESWDEKYEYLIDLGKKLSHLDKAEMTERNLIRGCQSSAWLVAEYRDGKVYFKADSDALIVKGLMSLLIRVLSGQSAETILTAKLNFIDTIGMHQHLAPTRSNGLRSMIIQLKSHAMTFKARNRAN